MSTHILRQQQGMPLRVAVYTRVSRADKLDTDFTSLDAQASLCERTVRNKPDLQDKALTFRHYVEPGVSGETIRKRKQLQQLIADLQAGLIDMIVVYRLDRLSRTTIDLLTFVSMCEELKVKLESATEPLDTASPDGMLNLVIKSGVAQFERQIAARRISDKIM